MTLEISRPLYRVGHIDLLDLFLLESINTSYSQLKILV